MGAVHGETGPARSNASTNWEGQPTQDWGRSISHHLAEGIDLKHADCDGDGIIDLKKDGAVIFQNAQGAFPQHPQAVDNALQMRIKPRHREITLGDELIYDVLLYNKSGEEVEDAYGVAFTMEHNLAFDDNPGLHSQNSWLGEENINLEDGFIKYGRYVDYVLSRKDKNSKRGSGRVTVAKHPRVGRDSDTSRWVTHIFITSDLSNSLVLNPEGIVQPVNILRATSMETVTLNIPWVSLDLKVNLQGAWDETLGEMHTTLNDSGYLPFIHPYKELFQARPDTIPSNIVDWVWVELRNKDNPAEVMSRRTGWLTKDGLVIDPEGGEGLAMSAREGSYYIVIGHRNHLAVRSSLPVSLSETQMVSYDFTKSDNIYGENVAVELSEGIFGLISGDINQDRRISYERADSDATALLSFIGAKDPTQITKGYLSGDLNMDGKVQFSGVGNDRAIILGNLGGDQPERVIHAQLTGFRN